MNSETATEAEPARSASDVLENVCGEQPDVECWWCFPWYTAWQASNWCIPQVRP